MSKLFNSIVHNNFQSQGAFWGNQYKLLNSLKEKSEQQIFDYQLSKLKSTLDNDKSLRGYGNVKNVYDDALKNIDMLKNFYDNEVPNHILEQIMNIMNAPFKAGSFRTEWYRKNGSVGGTYTDYKQVANAMQNLTNEIQKNTEKYGFGTVSLQRIQALQKSLKSKSKTSLDMYGYIQGKAGEAEQLTADVINNSEIYKNHYAFVTGQLERQGYGQIIQDVMTISKEDLNKKFKNGLLTYTIKGQGEKSVGSLIELLQVMENAPKEHHIILSDELYKELTNASVLSVQTKSGIDQKIINANKQRQIALETLMKGDYSEPSRAFRKLLDIENTGRKNNTQYFKDSFNSPEIQSWANYLLGKDIAKLLHFGQDQTHILFTDHGFETPYTWMKRTQMMLKFDAIINKIGSDFISTKRFYNLQKKK